MQDRGSLTGCGRAASADPGETFAQAVSSSGSSCRRASSTAWAQTYPTLPVSVLPRADWIRLPVKLHLGVTEEDEVRWRDRDRAVDAKYCDLELVAGLDGFGEYDAVRHVEALDGGGARIAAAPRHLAVDPHFRIIVSIGREHRFGAGGVEVADLGRDGQGRAIP